MQATARICDFAAAALDAGHAASEVPALALVEAQRLADQDVEINRDIGRHGAALIPPNSSVIHHCNTGALATVDIGTALGVIYGAAAPGLVVHLAMTHHPSLRAQSATMRVKTSTCGWMRRARGCRARG